LGRNHTLYFVFEIFVKDKNIHRIPIIDNDSLFTHLITQKNLIDFVHTNLYSIGSNSKRPLSMFRNVIKKVHCISTSDEAIKAFEVMNKKEIGGVGVTNNKGELVGTISLQDLKIVSNDERMFKKLYNSAKDFMIHLDKTYLERPYTIKTLKVYDTLEDVVNKLHYWKIHRVFIVDDDKNPIGVVGIKEVLQEVLF
jgi:CBS domain-containing protein